MIVHVTNAFPSSLAPVKGVFIKEQVDSLHKEGVDVDLHVISKENDGALAYLKAWWFMLRNAHRYDLVHCHHVLVGLLGVISVPRRKLVVSFMNDGRHNLKGRLAPFGWPVFWFLTCYCKWKVYKSRLPGRFAGSGAVLLPNGVNEELFTIQDRQSAKQRLGLDPAKRYVLFVSANTIRAEKRFDLFNEALSLVQQHDVTVEPLVMTHAAREEVPLYFNAASAHLLASDFEGSPNSVREALACGTPVVARNVGGVGYILEGVESCRVVEEATGAALGKALSEVLGDEELGELERTRLRQHLIDKGFTQRRVAQQLVALYQKAISQRGSHCSTP